MSNQVMLSSGYKCPILGLGTWQSKSTNVQEAIKHALKVGYRHIDTAAAYENENEVGAAIHAAMSEYGIKRYVCKINSF